jgi:hypothetical protein
MPVTDLPGWKLVWHDEFDGDAINSANWTFDIGGGGWGNGEAEFYTARPENARVENGMLVIEAQQEKHQDSYYTSARLKTQGLQPFCMGGLKRASRYPVGRGCGQRSGCSARTLMGITGPTAAKWTLWSTSAESQI